MYRTQKLVRKFPSEKKVPRIFTREGLLFRESTSGEQVVQNVVRRGDRLKSTVTVV